MQVTWFTQGLGEPNARESLLMRIIITNIFVLLECLSAVGVSRTALQVEKGNMIISTF